MCVTVIDFMVFAFQEKCCQNELKMHPNSPTNGAKSQAGPSQNALLEPSGAFMAEVKK